MPDTQASLAAEEQRVKDVGKIVSHIDRTIRAMVDLCKTLETAGEKGLSLELRYLCRNALRTLGKDYANIADELPPSVTPAESAKPYLRVEDDLRAAVERYKVATLKLGRRHTKTAERQQARAIESIVTTMLNLYS